MKHKLTQLFLLLFLISITYNCNKPPLTKLNDDKVSGKDVKTAIEAYLVPTNIVDAAINSFLIKIIAGINESSYYTRGSLDDCKQRLNLLRILGNDLAVLATCDIKEVKPLQ
ncbi:MAG: TIGR04452 family lipoprotein [Leptospira sp.]|nr:TIGR04452 family lipoprotein [Leptospira sp.]